MAMAPEHVGIGIRRYFTSPGEHPYDSVEWERREARITNYKDGTDAFFQPDVEFPTTWSLNATNIVAQKYFRGTLGTAEREFSLRPRRRHDHRLGRARRLLHRRRRGRGVP
jgi:ribonucleoside-diphosphate reductase alpha chain